MTTSSDDKPSVKELMELQWRSVGVKNAKKKARWSLTNHGQEIKRKPLRRRYRRLRLP